MNYLYYIATICLLSISILSTIILYVKNIRYQKQIKIQSEEIKQLNLKYQTSYNNLKSMTHLNESKLNEHEIKILLRNKPFQQTHWNKIEIFINNTQHNFTQQLINNFPTLTQEDIHIILLIRLHLSNKEIAEFYNIQLSSLSTKRYRLKKRMRLSDNVPIIDFINKLFTYESESA